MLGSTDVNHDHYHLSRGQSGSELGPLETPRTSKVIENDSEWRQRHRVHVLYSGDGDALPSAVTQTKACKIWQLITAAAGTQEQ